MMLDHHYAVVWRITGQPPTMTFRQVCAQAEWEEMLESHHAGHIIILECWEITTGRCVQN